MKKSLYAHIVTNVHRVTYLTNTKPSATSSNLLSGVYRRKATTASSEKRVACNSKGALSASKYFYQVWHRGPWKKLVNTDAGFKYVVRQLTRRSYCPHYEQGSTRAWATTTRRAPSAHKLGSSAHENTHHKPQSKTQSGKMSFTSLLRVIQLRDAQQSTLPPSVGRPICSLAVRALGAHASIEGNHHRLEVSMSRLPHRAHLLALFKHLRSKSDRRGDSATGMVFV